MMVQKWLAGLATTTIVVMGGFVIEARVEIATLTEAVANIQHDRVAKVEAQADANAAAIVDLRIVDASWQAILTNKAPDYAEALEAAVDAARTPGGGGMP